MPNRTEITAANILGERGIRYKRNVLAISLIITVLAWTNAPLGGVSLFGVSLPESVDSEATAWAIAAILLAYQFLMMAYYGWTDLVIWNSSIKENFKTPVSKIYFRSLKEGDVDILTEQGKEFRVIKVRTDDFGKYWAGTTAKKGEGGGSSYGFQQLLNTERASIKRRLNAFIFLEFGTPFLWGLGSLVVAISRN